MAMLLESAGVSLLHHGSSPTSTVALMASSSPATLPRSCTRLAVPGCSGLRRISPASRSSSSSSSSLKRTSRGIVCEQKQGTLATEGAVTDKSWKELVLDSDIPVLVDFWAPWCGPCRMIAPLVDELAVKYEGRVKCLKLNTDESPSTATEYGIRSIPTVMIFKGGVKKDTIIGAVPMAALVTAIEKYLDR